MVSILGLYPCLYLYPRECGVWRTLHSTKQPSTAPQTGTLTMASLQAENQQLQSENKELRARVAALEPVWVPASGAELD